MNENNLDEKLINETDNKNMIQENNFNKNSNESNKKEGKGSKIVLFIIIVIVVCGLLTGGYIAYDKLLNKENPTPNKDSYSKIDLPDLGLTFFIDYNKEYKYYATLDDVEKIDENELYNFDHLSDNNIIKVENNKLMWNIDGKWIQDKTITDDIWWVYAESLYDTMSDYIITKTNKIYKIDGEIGYDEEPNNEEFESFDYTMVEVNGTIEKVAMKDIYATSVANALSEFYVQIDGKVYMLDSDLISPEEYFKKANLNLSNLLENALESDGTCSIDNSKIDIDGTIEGLTNEENKPIKVKYYIRSEIGENCLNYIDFIIDENDYFYIIKENENKGKIKYKDKVTDIKVEDYDDYYLKFEITLQHNDKIYLIGY